MGKVNLSEAVCFPKEIGLSEEVNLSFMGLEGFFRSEDDSLSTKANSRLCHQSEVPGYAVKAGAMSYRQGWYYVAQLKQTLPNQSQTLHRTSEVITGVHDSELSVRC